MVSCQERGADRFHMVQPTPLPPQDLFSFNKIQNVLPCDAMLARYDMALCLCLSLCVCLCLSVTSRSSTKMTRRRITQTILHDSQDSSFLVPKIFAKFDRGQSMRGRQMQVGWVKIDDFRQITGYISKTVQDRRTFSIKVE